MIDFLPHHTHCNIRSVQKPWVNILCDNSSLGMTAVMSAQTKSTTSECDLDMTFERALNIQITRQSEPHSVQYDSATKLDN